METLPLCPLSDPAHPHKLHEVTSSTLTPNSICFTCKGEILKASDYFSCYYCICVLNFHFGCDMLAPEIKHPFHPSHPLTLISLDLQVYNDEDEKHEKCKCCRKRLTNVYYHCFICKFNFNVSCTKYQPPLTITPQKSHEHTLTLFPKRLPLPCDACGFSLEDHRDHVFACNPCNYMVHRTCIDLPRVIGITRHPHRLSFTSSLSPGDFSCGVCRKTVDINYGQYSCTKGCHYAIHSKCATREDVWDGIDLEGVPEESIEEIEPFVKIDENTIQHFSHDHYMMLNNNGSLGDHAGKFCDACIIPLKTSDSFYGCMECEFVLHEACANLPRKKNHPLHKHPLILRPTYSEFYIFPPDFCVYEMFTCHGCNQLGCGFVYECTRSDDCAFVLDVRCASLPDPLIHGCHHHPLFMNLTKGECIRCKSISNSSFFLECVECESFLCLTCANVPRVTYYKYDSHPLTLCYGEEEDATNLNYWCEICESKLDSKIWFYTCDRCMVTLHVTCLLGLNMYLKPLLTIKNYNDEDEKMEIVHNRVNSRPVCDHCARRCVDSLVYKCSDRTFCTLDCMHVSWIDEADD